MSPPQKTRKSKMAKIGYFWDFLDFLGQKTNLGIGNTRNMCMYDVWAVDEAF